MTDPLTVLLDEADARYGGHISTHYEGCYLDHVGCFAVAVRDVFEQAHAKELDTSTTPAKNGGDSLHVDQAHTPTDDEREALVQLVNDARLRPGTGRTMPEVAADVILSAGFRRTAVQEPSADDEHNVEPWSPTGHIDSPVSCKKCDRYLFIGADGEWQHVARREPQDEPTAKFIPGSNGAITVPNGEPTDGEVLVALNAFYADYPRVTLDKWMPFTVADMRAALRAAAAIGQEEKR